MEAEAILNNRPLTYIEDEMAQPVLTPNMILHGENIIIPSEDIDPDPEFDANVPTNMFHQLQSCKEKLWKRWYQEYLLALREKHQCTNDKGINLDIGDVVQIKGDQKNRGEWHVDVKINNVTIGAKIKLGTGTILE